LEALQLFVEFQEAWEYQEAIAQSVIPEVVVVLEACPWVACGFLEGYLEAYELLEQGLAAYEDLEDLGAQAWILNPEVLDDGMEGTDVPQKLLEEQGHASELQLLVEDGPQEVGLLNQLQGSGLFDLVLPYLGGLFPKEHSEEGPWNQKEEEQWPEQMQVFWEQVLVVRMGELLSYLEAEEHRVSSYHLFH